MTAEHDWSDQAAAAMTNALLRTSALRRLYLDSAQFHATIDLIVGIAPTIIDALADDAVEAEAAMKAAIRAAERAPATPIEIPRTAVEATMVSHRIRPPHETLIERIDAERAARIRARDAGHAYMFAAVRGGERSRDDADHWCEYCVGLYGVPHDDHHVAPMTPDGPEPRYHPDRELCPHASHLCACIDSAVINNRWLLTGKAAT